MVEVVLTWNYRCFFRFPKMSRVTNIVLLFYTFIHQFYVSGLVKEGCFTLHYNSGGNNYYWSEQVKSVNVELFCSTGSIHLQSVVFSIPVNWEYYCPSKECPIKNGVQRCDCCRKLENITQSCQVSHKPSFSQVTACSREKHCSFMERMQDLGKHCQLDYGCTERINEEIYNKCNSRWFEVYYDCIEGTEKTTTELPVPSTKVATTLAVTSLRTSGVTANVHKTTEQWMTYTTKLVNTEKNAQKSDRGVNDENLEKPNQLPVNEITATTFPATSSKIATTMALASPRTSDVTANVHKTTEQRMTYTTKLINTEKNAQKSDCEDKDEKLEKPNQLLVIGLSIGISLVTLLSVMIIALCHVRYKKLHQRYRQWEELISRQMNLGGDAPGALAESCQVQLLGNGNQNVVKYANNDNSESMAKKTHQNASPDTAVRQQPVYAQVRDDLKKKNRGPGIGGSNQWANPEQGRRKGELKDKGATGGTDAGSGLEMVENVYYEESAWA